MNQFRRLGYTGPDHFVEIITLTLEKNLCKKNPDFVR